MVAIQDYFKKKGYKVTGSSKNEDFNNIGNQYDACIITVFNDINDITDGMHFIAVTKKDGKYTVHNNGYNSSSVVYTSIDDVMKRIIYGLRIRMTKITYFIYYFLFCCNFFF